MPGGHGLKVVVLIRLILADLPHRCDGVGVVVRVANIQQRHPQFIFILPRLLIPDSIIQSLIAKTYASFRISRCNNDAGYFKPTSMNNILDESLPVEGHGVRANITMNGHNREVTHHNGLMSLLKDEGLKELGVVGTQLHACLYGDEPNLRAA